MKWPLLLLLAVLPLQWFVVVRGIRLHLLALFVFLVFTLATHSSRAFQPVLRVAWAFVVANFALNVVWLGANGYHGLGLRPPVEQLVYLAVSVAVGAAVYRALRSGGAVAGLRWAALVASVSLVGALTVSMALNGVNAAAVFGQTIAAADPEILQKELYRAAFTGFGFEEDVVSGNLRHEVFGALLLAMTVSAACVGVRPFRSVVAHRLYLGSMVLATALILLSLSRSVMIAFAVWPLLALLRAVLAMRLTPRLVGGIAVGAVATAVLAFTGVLSVLWVRFTQDTSSYQARDGLYQLAFDNIRANAVMGGVDTVSASSHNFVLDSWLRAGVFGAVAAAVVLVLLVGLFVSLAIRLHREPVWVLPAAIMLVLPLVRLMTAGGGQVPPVSWVGLGVAAGLLAYRRALLDDDSARPDADVAQARRRYAASSSNAGLSTQVAGSTSGHSTSPRLASRSDADGSGSSSSSK
ncbi:hypothetical protein ENKNEFLB_00780 [Nocardioides aquaticus]|uniref:O-antigen ligase domain-containing protein n=2 Tax=Nocardioides aquaticus TaxID=160826 RepID=A0ABX8ED60_9ACTN|nr:hypothetical protein ENKNEFLB_00780 [Nocardioides aquaticus]